MIKDIIIALGLGKPLGRGIILAVVTGAALLILQPKFAYADVVDPEDEEEIFTIAKPFALFANDEEKPYSTYFPWYFYPVLAFIIFAVFI